MAGKTPCQCDAPQTAHDVRKLSICVVCSRPGLRLIRSEIGDLHPLCAYEKYGPKEIAQNEEARSRTGLCCVGKAKMKRLLYWSDKVRRAQSK